MGEGHCSKQALDSWPVVFRRFLDLKAIDHGGFKESVDCGQCKMAQTGQYKESLKCCTYFPFLPCFSVGGVLAGGGPGASVVNDMIRNRQFVLPIGVVPSWQYRTKHKSMGGADFGQREDLLCPFFQKSTRNCTIWKSRNSACTTFYCSSDRGQAGLDAWAELYDDLYELEMHLVQEYLLFRGFSWEEICEQLEYLKLPANQMPIEYLPQEKMDSLWQHWQNQESRFFIEAFHWVSELSDADFLP